MHSVDYQLNAESVRIPAETVVVGGRFRLPDRSVVESVCHTMGDFKSYGIAEHRAVHPVGEQLPALVGWQALRSLLFVELDGERLLRIVLSGITTQTRAALCIIDIHSTVRIVKRQIVVFRPFLVLAADCDSCRNPFVCAARMLKHHYRQPGVGHLHHVVAAFTV